MNEWIDPRVLLRRYGLKARRRYSQNFLVAPSIVANIAETLGPLQGRDVLELGAGLGTLTQALIARGARVIAVELDPQLVHVLREEHASDGIRVVHADATTIVLADMVDKPVAIVGNLPYSVTGPILRNLERQRGRITKAVLMVQKEVGERLTAGPGNKAYGALTVIMSNTFDVRSVCSVRSSAFHPKPQVDSRVVELVPRDAAVAKDEALFRRVVTAAFSSRRKTLRNALASGLQVPTATTETVLAASRIKSDRRAETLSVSEFARLAAAWDQLNSSTQPGSS